ncbi:MAG: lipoate--protein ligase family protein [Dehalococcoidia bacterium]|nr:lipoate--protein ligase family protein [Dehalococcoidia bacterium]
MALDEAMYLLMKQRAISPALRLFRWSPPTVSIGRFQDVGSVDIQDYVNRGYPLVRRPTGGLTVLHDGDLSYAIVGIPGENGLLRSPRGLYRQAHEAFQEALSLQGLRPDLYSGAEQRTLAGLCNAVPMRSDLIVEGAKKIAGSAQMRGGGAVRQHGCIHLPPGINLDVFEEAVPASFERTMEFSFVDAPLTLEESELAEHLEVHKYSRDEWNLRGHDVPDLDHD